jgi:hypothetical protein
MFISAGIAVVAVGFAFYKYKNLAGIKAEIAKIEAEAVVDAKVVIARLKAKL